jgi:alpha-amylase
MGLQRSVAMPKCLNPIWIALQRNILRRCCVMIVLSVLAHGTADLLAQAGFDDDRVMLQGFYYESYRFGHTDKFPALGGQFWYQIVQAKAPDIASANFDLVWLPPPSYAGDLSGGYNPKQYFVLNNSFGTLSQQRGVLEALLKNGVEPIADIVINHRDGTNGWADFQSPKWGTWSICADDEAFFNSASGIANTPVDQRGKCEEVVPYRPGTTYAYPSFRDIAHTDVRVRRDIVRYLLALESLGYRGWRYDMVHGYGAQWIALYNKTTKPTFSVGEYDWDKQAEQRGWIWNTAVDAQPAGADHLKTSSDVFDFETQFSMKSAIDNSNYVLLYGFGNGIGLVGDTTDGLPWKERAVTFAENHDTGYRTNEDGTPQTDHTSDSFANNWQVEQAYALILTHPGVPCVYWKHYFEWGSDLQGKIKALINARKVAGINAGSTVNPQDNAKQAGIYAARVAGTHGDLYVRIGGSDDQWQPASSGYSDYREYAAGNGWKVWVKLPGNPGVQTAPHHTAFPLPKYVPASKQSVPF